VLVQFARAGTQSLKRALKDQITQMQERAQELKSRLGKDAVLSEEARSVFYSSWIYSGVRNLSNISNYQNVDDMSAYLKIPREKLQKIIEFLLMHSLCREEDGKIVLGHQRTHLESSSPLVQRHHSNWRIKAISKMDEGEKKDLYYTGPMSLSEEGAGEIRKQLVDMIERATKVVIDSSPQVVRCLNIDWFEY
jgi:hypothetical protein